MSARALGRKTVTKLFGGLLMAIGILIATLSGLCGAWLLLEMSGGRFSDVVGVVIFLGAPFIVGIGLFYLGRALVRGE